MDISQGNMYYEGYTAGYRDGFHAAVSKVAYDQELTALPIKALFLSTRAYNCLSRAGCVCVADVAALSESTIATMRNLGSKTASEVARQLAVHGIIHTAWSAYL